MRSSWDVVVIGAGPAGLAAAVAAHDSGARVCLVEREDRSGGILKQCIHDGFGLVRYGQKLTGPEYAWRDLQAVQNRGIEIFNETFLLKLAKDKAGFILTLQNREQAVFQFEARALVAATGCRERTARQVSIHGQRPAGVFTAGTVQRLVNIDGYLPGRRCIILGSGDIGLIMARRLTLEGAEVLGVYELKAEPSGLARNIVQCLEDYKIPLHLSRTVITVHGRERVEGVTISQVDENLKPVPGTEEYVSCDTLILSVGLIPENDILTPLGVEIDPGTGGPVVDQRLETNIPGLFSCGNALHVNDLVDYVSESGETAGKFAAQYALGRAEGSDPIPIKIEGDVVYVVPQRLDLRAGGEAVLYFRSARTLEKAVLDISAQQSSIAAREHAVIRPPEMERISVDTSKIPANAGEIIFKLGGKRNE